MSNITPGFPRSNQRPCNTMSLCQLTCLSSPCVVCSAHALAYCARRPTAAKASESPITAVNLYLSEHRTKQDFPARGGARGKPDLSESKLRLHYNKTLSIIGHVGKGRICPSFRLFAPLRFFRFRRSTSWYVIGPCKPLDITS